MRSLECIVLTPQEFREQADLCIDRARTEGSGAERKLYRRLALTWLEIVIWGVGVDHVIEVGGPGTLGQSIAAVAEVATAQLMAKQPDFTV